MNETLEIVKLLAAIGTVWFGLIGWTLFRPAPRP